MAIAQRYQPHAALQHSDPFRCERKFAPTFLFPWCIGVRVQGAKKRHVFFMNAAFLMYKQPVRFQEQGVFSNKYYYHNTLVINKMPAPCAGDAGQRIQWLVVRKGLSACQSAGRVASAPCRSAPTSSTNRAQCGTPTDPRGCPTVYVGGT